LLKGGLLAGKLICKNAESEREKKPKLLHIVSITQTKPDPPQLFGKTGKERDA